MKGPSVYYMIAMSGSASDHSLSLNFSLLSSLFKWLQVFFSSSSSAHAPRSPVPPSQQCAVYPKHVRPLHSSYLQFSPRICALLLSCSVFFSSLLCIHRAAVTAWDRFGKQCVSCSSSGQGFSLSSVLLLKYHWI